MTDTNRREFTRIDLDVEVVVTPEGFEPQSGTTTDLSLNGIWLPGGHSIPSGTPCTVQLDWAALVIFAAGAVTRVTDTGFAVEFRSLELESFHHLQNLLRFNALNPTSVEAEFASHLGLKRREPTGTEPTGVEPTGVESIGVND